MRLGKGVGGVEVGGWVGEARGERGVRVELLVRGRWVRWLPLRCRAAALRAVPAVRVRLFLGASLGVALFVLVGHVLAFFSWPVSAVPFLASFPFVRVRLVFSFFGCPRGYPLEWHVTGDGYRREAGWAAETMPDAPTFHRDRPL